MTEGSTGAPQDDGGSGQPSPMARLGGTIRRLPRYLGLARALVRDPSLSRWRKAALGVGLAYVAMPLDLVPGIIPVAGQLDDLAALLIGLRVALRGCSPEAAAAHLREAGLSPDQIEQDLAAVRDAAAWLAGKVASGAGRAGAASLRGAGRLLRFGVGGAGRLAARAAKRAK
jgi:uncharacterized membrane protein YkvA (DUF1232 family)